MGERIWQVQGPYQLWIVALILPTLIHLGMMIVTRSRRSPFSWECAAPTVAALAAFFFMGTREWVRINGFDYRYSMPSLLLLQLVAFFPVVAPLRARLNLWPFRRIAYLASAFLLFGAALWSYGLPSLGSVKVHIDQRLGECSHEVVVAGCTHVAGDYWFVWKTVYHANLLKSEQALPGEVWGIAFRGHPAWSRWRGMPLDSMRVGIQPDCLEEANQLCDQFDLPPLEVVEKHQHIWVCRPKR